MKCSHDCRKCLKEYCKNKNIPSPCPAKEPLEEISLCKRCYSMTKKIDGKCGKCKEEKE
jgi:hypothetical protein